LASGVWAFAPIAIEFNARIEAKPYHLWQPKTSHSLSRGLDYRYY
jgi:hypothetical protein